MAPAQRVARRELAQLLDSERERARRIDLLRFQLDEIDGAALRVDEEEELEIRRRRLQNLVRLQAEPAGCTRRCTKARTACRRRPTCWPKGRRRFGRWRSWIRSWRKRPSLLDAAAVQVREAAGLLRRYAEQLEADPAELEEVQQRLAVISELKRKYGADVAEVLAFADELRHELQTCWSTVKAARSELTEEIAALDQDAAARRPTLSSAEGGGQCIVGERRYRPSWKACIWARVDSS